MQCPCHRTLQIMTVSVNMLACAASSCQLLHHCVGLQCLIGRHPPSAGTRLCWSRLFMCLIVLIRCLPWAAVLALLQAAGRHAVLLRWMCHGALLQPCLQAAGTQSVPSCQLFLHVWILASLLGIAAHPGSAIHRHCTLECIVLGTCCCRMSVRHGLAG